MRVLGWLERAFVPLKRVDPRFGDTTFMRMSTYIERDGVELLVFELEGDEPRAVRAAG